MPSRGSREASGRSLGVVLSGGGARGFAHIGVLEGLHAAGFEIDRIGGCSIGSFIGAMAALGWSTEKIMDVCESGLVRRAPFGITTIPILTHRARRAAAMLERVFGATLLEEIERPFFAVSADLLREAPLVEHRRGPVFEGSVRRTDSGSHRRSRSGSNCSSTAAS